MARVYKCKMARVATVNIRANSAEEADDWINTHSFSDLEKMASDYEVDYDDRVIGEVAEKAAIDISK